MIAPLGTLTAVGHRPPARAAAALLALLGLVAPIAHAQVTPIADIQANPASFDGRIVTVQGQVYVPANYRAPAVYSGYIQDSSSRGLNLFGNAFNNPILFDRGNVVQVTGTVTLFFTTVEITNPSAVTLVSLGNAPLQPTVLTTAAAASSQWEGTFIESEGTIAAVGTTGGTSPAHNYTVNDGSGPVVIRVVDNLGVPVFTVGQTIRGRGAGSQFQTDFQILVGGAADVFVTGGDTTPPTLVGAGATTATAVGIDFSESVAAASAEVASNYEVFATANPTTTIPVATATRATSGTSVTLTLGAPLQNGVDYTVRVNNVQDTAGNPIAPNSTITFTFTAVPVTPIATIQANPAAFNGQVVTVEGQVYVPANYRGDTTFSGYIQDESGRGINLFGGAANNSLLFDTANVVRVTGTVGLFFTTVEITDLTEVTQVSTGNPPLQPQVLSTAAAASTQWEGTFIQSTGVIAAVATTGGTAPAHNYTVNDGSGPLVIRVVDHLGVAVFSVGQTITGRGAGTQFQTDFQVLVGRSADVFLGGGGADTTPPTLASAAATTATQVTVSFSEAVSAATAEVAANYAVFETANQAAAVPVTGATRAPSGTAVTLALGGSLQNGVNYTVRVNNVQDLAGNPIAPNSTRTFTFVAVQVTPIATIQANPSAFDGQVVTVEGQVYVPTNYRGDATFSGYIQDGSGRGINLFGNAANNPALFDISNFVRVTGTVGLFFTTVEVTSITQVMLISTGNPPLQPRMLSTGAAASSSWEGTFIQCTGPVVAVATTGGSAPAHNYTINDGTGPIVIRVLDVLAAPLFAVGQTLTGRGAGSQFQADFQIVIGRTADVFVGGGGPDTTPPTVIGAFAPNPRQVTVNFSETVAAASAAVAANYTVAETDAPSRTVPVETATLSANRTAVALGLGADLANGGRYTVTVRNVADDAGNGIETGNTASFVFRGLSLEGPRFTFVPGLETYPIRFSVPITTGGTTATAGSRAILLRVFDLQGRLRRTLLDSKRLGTEPLPSTVAWNGRDDATELVPAGTYVVHLLVVDNRTGEREVLQMPVVVATRLNR